MAFWKFCLWVPPHLWNNFLLATKQGTGYNFNIARRPEWWYNYLSADSKNGLSVYSVSQSHITISAWVRDYPSDFWTITRPGGINIPSIYFPGTTTAIGVENLLPTRMLARERKT
jgi:hypothetical protein